MQNINCFEHQRKLLVYVCALTFVLTIKCIAFTTCVSAKLFKDRKKQSLASIPSFRITFARFAAIWSITSADIPTITVKSVCFPFSNLCVRGETLKIGSILLIAGVFLTF